MGAEFGLVCCCFPLPLHPKLDPGTVRPFPGTFFFLGTRALFLGTFSLFLGIQRAFLGNICSGERCPVPRNYGGGRQRSLRCWSTSPPNPQVDSSNQHIPQPFFVQPTFYCHSLPLYALPYPTLMPFTRLQRPQTILERRHYSYTLCPAPHCLLLACNLFSFIWKQAV